MKRTITVFLAIAICTCFSVIAFADGLEAAIRYVDCTVTNPSGAIIYYKEYTNGKDEYKTSTIPYNTVISVCGIYDDTQAVNDDERLNGRRIGYVHYNESYGYIDLSDVAITNGELSLNAALKIEYPPTYIVAKYDGVTMYAGPSPVFDEVCTIPNGAEITLTYKDVGDDDHQANTFYYTEYNGLRGWVYRWEDHDYLRKVDKYSEYTGKIEVTGEDVCFVDIFSETVNYGNHYGYKKVGDPIPVGTVLSFEYYYEKSRIALAEYNGTSGYIDLESYSENNSEVISYINDDAMLLVNSKVYSGFNDPDSETGEIIPAYTLLSAKAYCRYNRGGTSGMDHEWFLVDYNGNDVWLYCSQQPVPNGSISDIRLLNRYNENQDYYHYKQKGYYKINTSSVDIQTTPEDSTNIVYTVTSNDILRGFFWYRVDDGTDTWMRYVEVVGSDKAGWINDETIELYYPDSPADIAAIDSTEADTVGITATASITNKSDPVSELEKAANSSKAIIIICAVAAVLIAVAAIIAIVSIKKKRTR